jgi:hypothetical protein
MKKNIIITNTGTVITPYEKGQCDKLERWTSVYNNALFKYDSVIGFVVLDNENSCFVTTKNSPDYIKSFFPDYDISISRENTPKKIKHDFDLNDDITPSDIQSTVIKEIMDLNYKKEWFVNLQTGLGKTLLSIYLISLFKCKSMIMCYSKNILYQWVKSIEEKTTFNTSRILIIDSSLLLYKIYTSEFDTSGYDIFMATPKLITAFCNQYGFSILYDIFNILGIGLKIYDEAHRNITNMVKINGFTNVSKTLYLSADFSQADKDKEKLYYKMMYGVPIIKPTNELMSTLKYTQAIVVFYNTSPSINDVKTTYTRYGFSSNNYMEYQFKNGTIVKVLDYIMKNINTTNITNHKMLILVSQIEIVDRLSDILKEKYTDFKIARFHSKVDIDEKEFAITDANIIIATYQSFGTGMDVENIKYVISLDQCNKIWDNQAAGRARPLKDGTDAFYFMCVDRGFTYAIKKLNVRLNYLQETKIKKITKITYYPIN